MCGQIRDKILEGEYYFILFFDDYTIMTWVSFLKQKSKAFEKFKAFITLIENETNFKIKCIRSNNGEEFT